MKYAKKTLKLVFLLNLELFYIFFNSLVETKFKIRNWNVASVKNYDKKKQNKLFGINPLDYNLAVIV